MLTVETCSTCRGAGIVEQFQERFGDEWRPERGTLTLPEHAKEEMRAYALKVRPWSFRWVDIECPRCLGDGEYVVEHFRCKIF